MQRQREHLNRHSCAAVGAAACQGIGRQVYQYGVAQHQCTFAGQVQAKQRVQAHPGELCHCKTGQLGKFWVDCRDHLLMVQKRNA